MKVRVDLGHFSEDNPPLQSGLDEFQDACNSEGISLSEEVTGPTKVLQVSMEYLPNSNPEAFRFHPQKGGWELSASSVLGVARGLIHLADWIRVTGGMPAELLEMNPALPLRYMLLSVGSLDTDKPPYYDESRYHELLDSAKDGIREAHRYGANNLLIGRTYKIAAWGKPPHSERTEIYRHLYSDVAREAHRYGMKILTIGDEFLYQDEMLRAHAAKLSLEDDGFWEILQNRYREILEEVRALDGIGVRIGEMLPIGNIRSFDVIHNQSTLSREEKYRRFVRAMYDVVVEEFDKLYFHRTWVVNDWEQHSVPVIFRSIFEEIPNKNLIISIKLTKCDQWWYQAYNPTLGQTTHNAVVELEQVHGPHGSMTYPDYMGEWFEAGLKYALGRGVKGTFMGPPWNLWMDSHFYAAQRLMWQPSLTAGELARDWASRTFGRKAAGPIGRMLLLSDDAMKKSLYIRPYASTHPWNPLGHLMTEMFVVEGDPYLDGGREHARFLREMYLLSKPQFDETLNTMREGLELYGEMIRLFSEARAHIRNENLSSKAWESLVQGRSFLELNVAYVAAFMNFFRYEDEDTVSTRRSSLSSLRALKKALERYRKDVDWYSKIGIETFIELADAGLEDLGKYRKRLSEAPSHFESQTFLAKTRMRDEELISAEGARRILRFEADIDGAELLILKGRNLKTIHIADEATTGVKYKFFEDLPRCGTLAIKPIEVRGWAYVVEQPTDGNQHTARIMVQDPQDGRSVYKIEVYWIPEGT